MDDSWLLQESNLAARQPRRAPHHVIQAIRVKDLPKVPAWGLEWDSNQQPSALKALNTTEVPPSLRKCVHEVQSIVEVKRKVMLLILLATSPTP